MENNNHAYNILTQLTQEMKSAWRIEKHYIPESESDEEQVLWERILQQKKIDIEALKELSKTIL